LGMVRDICHKDNLVTIVVIHDLNLALRFCDRFLLLQNGRVHAYGDHSVLNRNTLMDVYGVHANVVEVEGKYMVCVKEEGVR